MFKLLPFVNHYTFLCNKDIEPSVLLELSSNLPASTSKKRIIKKFIELIAKFNLIGFLPKETNNEILSRVNFDSETDYLVFSQDLRLRKRLYVFKKDFFNVIVFSKIIWGKERENVTNEIYASKVLAGNNDFNFIVPSSFVEINEFVVLNYPLLPKDAILQVVKPKLLFDYILKINTELGLIFKSNFSDIIQTDWWQNFKINEEYNNFISYVYSILNKKEYYKLMFCHGDLGSENVFKYNNKFILIDWEKSSQDAPFITDYLGIILGNNCDVIISQKTIVKNPDTLISFYNSKISNSFSYEEFLLGLVFYIGTNFNLAIYLIKNFTYEDSIR